MGKASDRTRTNKDPALTMFPMMNLMVILVPFLLTSAAFYHMAIVNTTVLTDNPETGKIQDTQIIPLDLYLYLKAEGLTLESSRPMYEGKSRVDFPMLPPGNTYDFPGLRDILIKVKTENELVTTMFILADPGVTYDNVIKAIDHCRDDGKPVPSP